MFMDEKKTPLMGTLDLVNKYVIYRWKKFAKAIQVSIVFKVIENVKWKRTYEYFLGSDPLINYKRISEGDGSSNNDH